MDVRIIPILALASVGCASYLGPIDDPEFEQLLRSSMSVSEQDLLLTGRGVWYPTATGTEIFTNPELVEQREVGLLVVFDAEITLVRWNEDNERYDVQRRYAYSDLSDVRLEEWGVSALIVLTEAQGGGSHAFNFTSGSGSFGNRARTLKTLPLLEERISVKVLDYRD